MALSKWSCSGWWVMDEKRAAADGINNMLVYHNITMLKRLKSTITGAFPQCQCCHGSFTSLCPASRCFAAQICWLSIISSGQERGSGEGHRWMTPVLICDPFSDSTRWQRTDLSQRFSSSFHWPSNPISVNALIPVRCVACSQVTPLTPSGWRSIKGIIDHLRIMNVE